MRDPARALIGKYSERQILNITLMRLPLAAGGNDDEAFRGHWIGLRVNRRHATANLNTFPPVATGADRTITVASTAL